MAETATKKKPATNGKVTKKVALPDWKSDEAKALMKKRTKAFLAKFGDSEVMPALQELLTLSTKLTGYRQPCQELRKFKPAEPEAETSDEEDEEEDED
jgi:hypothetical protein